MMILRTSILLGITVTSICAIVVQPQKTLSSSVSRSMPTLAFRPELFKIKRSTVESSHRIPLPDVISSLVSTKQPALKISPSPISRFKSSKSNFPRNPISQPNNELPNPPSYRPEPFTPHLTSAPSIKVPKISNSHGPSAFLNMSTGPYAVHERPYRQLFGLNNFETPGFDDFSDPYKKFFGNSKPQVKNGAFTNAPSSFGGTLSVQSQNSIFKPSWPEFKTSQPPEVFGAQPTQQSASHFQPSRAFYNGEFVNERFNPPRDGELNGKKLLAPLLHGTSEFLEPPPAFATSPIVLPSEASLDYRPKASFSYGFSKPTNVKLGNIPNLTGSPHRSGKGTIQQPRRSNSKNVHSSYVKAPNDYQELKNQPQFHFGNNPVPAVAHNKHPVFHYNRPSGDIRTDVEVVKNKRPKPIPPPVPDEDSDEEDRDDDEGYRNSERDDDDYNSRPNSEPRKRPRKDMDDDDDFSFKEFDTYGKYPRGSSSAERPSNKRTHYMPRYEDDDDDFVDDEKPFPKSSSFGYDDEDVRRPQHRKGSSKMQGHRGRISKSFKEFPGNFEDDFPEDTPHSKRRPESTEEESPSRSSYSSSEESPKSEESTTNYEELDEPEEPESHGPINVRKPPIVTPVHEGNPDNENESSEEVNDDFFGEKIRPEEDQSRYAKNHDKRLSNAATSTNGKRESSTNKVKGPYYVKNTTKMNDEFSFLGDDEFPNFSERQNGSHKKPRVKSKSRNNSRDRSKITNSKNDGKEIDYFANDNIFDDIDV